MADGIQDIRIAVGFPDHFKTKKLVRLAGEESVRCLLRLWLWAAMYRPKGDLTGLDDEDIEDACGWAGDAGVLLGAMRTAGYLHGSELNGWEEHQPYAFHKDKRVAQAKKAASARHAKRYAQSSPDSNAGSSAKRNAPTPTPPPTPTPVGGRGAVREPPSDPTGSAAPARNGVAAGALKKIRDLGCPEGHMHYVRPLPDDDVIALASALETARHAGDVEDGEVGAWVFRWAGGVRR